jgi:hypothetical protein
MEDVHDMPGTSKSQSYWADAMASDGFVVECGHAIQGEVKHDWFVVIAREPSLISGLHKIPADSPGRSTSSPVNANDYWITAPLSEAEVRSKLRELGLSPSDSEAKLEWARRWATTITRQPDSEPVLWWPRKAD